MFIIGMHDRETYMKGAFIVAADRIRQGPLHRGSFKNWMLILVLLCENERKRVALLCIS